MKYAVECARVQRWNVQEVNKNGDNILQPVCDNGVVDDDDNNNRIHHAEQLTESSAMEQRRIL